MRKILLFIAFCYSIHSNSQTLINIFDKTNFQPIENVHVFINNQPVGTTNHKGQIKINTKAGDQLTFNHISYESNTIKYEEIVNKNFKIYLTQKTNLLKEYTVSATRFESEKRNTAQAISIIDKYDNEKFQSQNTAELIQNSAYAFVQKSQMGGGSPIIRGFEANKVLLVIDGIRMNNAIYRGGHLQNIITVDPQTLNNVEILEGPGSVLYGSDALGGTIYMQTKQAILNDSSTFATNGNMFIKTATANKEKTAHIEVNIANNKIASLTSISYSNFDDLRQGNNRNPFYGDWGKRLFYVERINNKDSMFVNSNPNIQKGSGYAQYDIMQKLLYKVNSNLQVLANIQYSNSSDVPRYDRLTQMSGSLPKYAEWYYGPQKRILTYLQLEQNKTCILYDKMRITPSYQNIEESRHDRKFNKTSLNHRIEKLDIIALNGDFFKTIQKNTIIYGVESSYEKVNSTANTENILTNISTPLDTRYPDGGSKMQRASVFINHSYQISEKFSFYEGIRYNISSLESKFIDTTFYHFTFDKIKQKNDAITANAGMVYKIAPFFQLNLNYSSGYRTPNVDDLSKIFESVPGMVIMPNEKLKPEYTHTIDFGYKTNIQNNFIWATNVYYTFYNNAITTEPGTFNGQDSVMYNGQLSKVLTNVNKTKAYLYGINSQISISLNSNLNFIGNVNYTYGRIETDSTDYPLDHIPPVYGKIGFQYKTKRLNSEVNMMFNGWKFTKDYNMFGEDNFTYATNYGMPSWITFNFYASYQVHKIFQLNGGIENILDQNYRVFASNISAPGRNFKFGIKFIW